MGSIKIFMGSTGDADAAAFILAAGLTDSVQISAINTLVIGLKDANIWSKMKAIYPFVGGTAASHKWNLKDARDLDVAFRLVFSGTWSHSENGATPATASAYTFLNPSTILSQNSISLGYYSRTNISGNQIEIGAFLISTGAYLTYRYSGTAYKSMNSLQTIRGSLFTPTIGLLIGTRTSATNEKYYHRGVLVDNLIVNSIAPTNNIISIGQLNGQYSTKQCAFASIGDGLTDTDALNLYNLVQAYQTTLGRQV